MACGLIFTRRQVVAGMGAAAGTGLFPARGADAGLAPQPYFAGVGRIVESLSRLGAALPASDAAQLAALAGRNDGAALEAAEKILDRHTLVRVAIGPDGAPHAAMGGAPRRLMEQGWRAFLIRVSNPGGVTDRFELLTNPRAMAPGQMNRWIAEGGFSMAQKPPVVDSINNAGWLKATWWIAELADKDALSGFPVEYRIVQIFSRDRGARRTTPSFRVGGETRRGGEMDFECLPTRDVGLRIIDADGRGCVASLTITDSQGRIYPPQMMRIAPDLEFQRHVYRGDGETVRLPDGDYTVESKRGPEYLPNIQTFKIAGAQGRMDIALKRWIDPAGWGWYAGDPHIHAAGCAHYDVPTQGVSPETVIRHVRGEGLSVAGVLTWGPGYEYQKQFFTGRAISPHASMEHPELQAANNASLIPRDTPKDQESQIRYDLEVSRFPSSHAGHLTLLRLSDQDYPGAKRIEDWPSWNLPILKWARAQGGVAGYSHCGAGLDVDSTELPNFIIPAFDATGCAESIIDVTHDAVDFLAGCDLSPLSELNAWYHMLNCGFRLALVGETDFPCITDERPGMGRSYVQLDRRPMDNDGYEAWIAGFKKGKLYSGDGRSHMLRFEVNGQASGGEDVVLGAPGTVRVSGLVAGWLEPIPTPATRAIRKNHKSWHLEHARIGDTRTVAVELVVNGIAVDRQVIAADGAPHPVEFRARLPKSAWVALRVLPSVHSHPVFARVAGKPIRASRRSARWCRSCVDKVWEVKSPFMRTSDLAAAALAFDHARTAYDRIIRECDTE
jgi:hypothetical protein